MTRRLNRSSGERGAAIVLAMLLATLAAAVAVTVFAEQRRWSEAVLHRRDQVQAQALAMAGVQWARQILNDDARRGAIDHLGEPWAVPLPAIPLENGSIRGVIADAQAGLNINTLGTPSAAAGVGLARIERLLAQQGVPRSALNAIADWIDADGEPRPNGAEDARYLSQPVPYLPANTAVLRLAELADVLGIEAGTLAPVSAFLSALPAEAAVNVNTAPAEVLAAIVDSVSADALAELVAGRAQRPFTTVAEFRSRLPQGAVLTSDLGLSVRSDFFLVTVEALQGATIARTRALLQRRAGEWPAIVWQVVE
jgi:general secretion pathway protein K